MTCDGPHFDHEDFGGLGKRWWDILEEVSVILDDDEHNDGLFLERLWSESDGHPPLSVLVTPAALTWLTPLTQYELSELYQKARAAGLPGHICMAHMPMSEGDIDRDSLRDRKE